MKRFKPGVSFSDFVVTDVMTSRGPRLKESMQTDYRKGFVIWLIVLVAFGVMMVRLLELQVFYGGKYKQLSEENRVKKLKIQAVRGSIVDRDDKVIAQTVLGNQQREYPPGEVVGHLVGFLGEVGTSEVGLVRPNGRKFEIGDLVGRSGLEKKWDEKLRGEDGGRLVEVDNNGNEVRELGKREPVDGEKLVLNLDLDLQQTAHDAVGEKIGAVVVSNPKTGAVLAMVSRPGFDPNTLNTQYSALSARSDIPLLNRAIGGIYPPGSTFKMVTTLAALVDAGMSPSFTYVDTGVVTVGNYKYTSWFFTQSGGVEGTIGWKKALARSTDTFYYKVGEQIGIEKIAKRARTMGFGESTGIDIDGEVVGLVPDPDWKERAKKEAWFLGDTFIVSIGQGDLLATPIQVNMMTNVIATNGKKCPLRLVGENKCDSVGGIDPLHWEIAQEGMLAACSTGGTAYPFFEWNQNNKEKVACKTGTSEYLLPNGKTGTHAWLTAYAPTHDPAISATVIIEGGGEGSRTAAPVIRKIMAKYFGIEDKFDYKGYLPKSE